MEINGYQRPDGQIGIRNHVAVIYTNDCAKVVCRRIGRIVEGVHVFGWPNGCVWNQLAFDKLVALGKHPNVAAALVVGIGCERIRAKDVAAQIALSGKPAAHVVIEEIGGTLRAIEEGSRLVLKMVQAASQVKRVPLPVQDLVIAVDCSASDGTSGLASNPACGVTSDLHIEAGGTSYFLDVPEELIGCGDCLASRACNRHVGEELRAAASVAPDDPKIRPPYGNVMGGITTFKEKAAGALAKAGSKSINGVIRNFVRPQEKGLYMVSCPLEAWTNDSDPQCVMILAACGAHLVIETTGCGTVTGGVVAPVLKVCANPDTCRREPDNMDVDASAIMSGERTIAEMGQSIYEEALAVAAGKLTFAEILGHFED